GLYTDKKGTQKVVVACKDFTQDGSKLHEFNKLALSVYEMDKRVNLSIENVNLVIQSSAFIKDKDDITSRFWDMFVVDALIGNSDRYFDNWGLLEKDGAICFAPIYDCGSSLGALLSDEDMEINLKTPDAFKNKEFNITSCYYMNDKRIFYHEIFKNPLPELRQAIARIVPFMDMGKICESVNSVESMSDVRKAYLIKAMDMRYTQILVPAFQKNIIV
ncbi:MAG: hypothetical protein LBI03_05045, partial [Clostridiales bacterium]|nr:hypothetical protein [Clostridiales bacterium]